MAGLKKYNTFIEFVNFNRELIAKNPFFYFNLERTISRVLRGEVKLYNFFNVVDNENAACALVIENECLLYATKASSEIISLVADGLEFTKFNRYMFFGSKNIIDGLFSSFNVLYSEDKYRKYYECSAVNEPFDYCLGEASNAEVTRLHDLVLLSDAFNKEFYNGEKTDYQAHSTILNGIQDKTLYQWICNDTVAGIAEVMYNFDHPIIGHVFTHEDFRGKGIASSLVHKITNGLLQNGFQKCLLMTNAYNPASNKSFQKVGYQLTGEYVVRYKNA